jgi:hypothetical protein
MTGAGVSPLVVKEIRALLYPWVACLAAMLAFEALGSREFRGFGTMAYMLGAAVLGALAFGHEYNHRTLAMLLSQPVRRQRVFMVKMMVLLAMLVILRAVAEVTLNVRGGASPLQREFGRAALWLPVMNALVVAPWLTMVSRNPVAGAVFTGPLPFLFLLVGELPDGWLQYEAGPERDRFLSAFVWAASAGLGALGAVMTPRTFMRLEAIDGRGRDVRLPTWLNWRSVTAARSVSKSHPLWLLFKKELHLQQMTFGVAAIWAAVWMASIWSSSRADNAMDVIKAITFFYALLIAMLIGSLASAQERQLGTLEWQVMLPPATSWQWTVKVTTVFALASVVALGVPAFLVWLTPARFLDIRTGPGAVQPQFAVLLVLVVVGSLYVSSLCANGIQALLIAAAATPAIAFFLQTVLIPLGGAVFDWAGDLSRQSSAVRGSPGGPPVDQLLALVAIAIVLGVVLRFARANHRSGERGGARALTQVAWIAASVMIATTVWSAVVGYL